MRCSCAFVTEVGVRGCVTYALMPVMEMNVWEDVHCRLSMTDAVHMPPSHSGSDTLHSHDFRRPHSRFRSHRCHPRNPAPTGPVSAEHGPAARGRVDGQGGAAAPLPAPCAPRRLPPSHTPRDARLPRRRSQEARLMYGRWNLEDRARQSEVRAERNRGAGGVVIPRGVGTVG